MMQVWLPPKVPGSAFWKYLASATRFGGSWASNGGHNGSQTHHMNIEHGPTLGAWHGAKVDTLIEL